jgi:hypothetical protein
MSPEAAEDALRDALALIRAAMQDDGDAAATVAANLSCPELTTELLAQWCAELMTRLGITEEFLGAWQRSAGLS